jgi:hypothetical protein
VETHGNSRIKVIMTNVARLFKNFISIVELQREN